ncbi:MAG: SpoIID/LytB domain-containing protein [Acidimicrobiia bacterium]
MRRFFLVGIVALLVVAATTTSVSAIEQPTQVVSIELVGDSSTRFEVDGRRYAGPISFTSRPDGIAFTESASIEQYLQGIAEMPFLWHPQALAAQAVAARTYLARRLLGNRKGDAARYEFDICATSRCQVYRGVQYVEGEYGDRWKTAVETTAGEVLLYEGQPIEAVYSSQVGSRSRANQDVWASSPIPYLQPVDSPEIGIAPYAEWTVEVTGEQFVAILKADGYEVSGALESIVVDDPPEGEGRTSITVASSGGTDSLLAPNLKGAFNRRGEGLFPGVLPVRLGEGKLLPQPLPSYTFEISRVRVEPTSLDSLLPSFDRQGRDVVTIDGEGWGHGVGMSQWGAQIMAKNGSTYAEILSYYYTGTAPEVAPSVVPENVVVGLDWGRASIPLTLTGSARVVVNDVRFGTLGPGDWVIRSTPFGIDVIPAGLTGYVSLIGQRLWPR